MKLFAFGLGYTARDFIARYGAAFETVYATRRVAEGAARERENVAAAQIELVNADEPNFPRANANANPADEYFLSASGETKIKMFAFGKDEEDAAVDKALRDSDVILVSVPPGISAEPVLARYGRRIASLKGPVKILYLSTIGVYGDRGGEWVDEERLPMPKNPRSKARLRAEKAWLAFGKDDGKTVHVLRLAGIYGPGRNALVSLATGTARRIVEPGQVFNRIHVADISAVIAALLYYDGDSEIWNLSDDEPAPPQDVITYAAALLGIEPPPVQSLEEAALSPLGRSFYGENKRAANGKIKSQLDITLQYPTYREGLVELIEDGEGCKTVPIMPQ